MNILVLGAGVVGVTTAWFLREAGHTVTVVDRQAAAGMETSFANGGQISVSHAEPWANPSAPLKVLKWLGKEDAPLLFRLKMDPQQWRWGLQFMLECLPKRTTQNTINILRLGLYSRGLLQQLRAETGITYDEQTRGILHFYTSQQEFDNAVAMTDLMRSYGCDRQVLGSAAEIVAIDPAFNSCKDRIIGATYTASDESGDAHQFTQKLVAHAATQGVGFLWNYTIKNLLKSGGEITGVEVMVGEKTEILQADAYVLCLGSYSPLLSQSVGVPLNIYPAKGYSATVSTKGFAAAPFVSMTDDEYKLVFSRLGDRLRIAGTAELNGYNLELNAVRCHALIQRTQELFPDAADYTTPEFWTGLRPATPSNVPYIGKSRLRNLFLNTGHGTLGWTHACGSAQALADLMSNQTVAVDFPFLGSKTS